MSLFVIRITIKLIEMVVQAESMQTPIAKPDIDATDDETAVTFHPLTNGTIRYAPNKNKCNDISTDTFKYNAIETESSQKFLLQ